MTSEQSTLFRICFDDLPEDLLAGWCPLQPCIVTLKSQKHHLGTCSSSKVLQEGNTSPCPRVAWATRALEKVVSWVVASSGMCQKKEPRSHILVLFWHHVPFPINPKPALTAMLRVLSNKGHDSMTLKERRFQWEPQHQETWGAGKFSKLFWHRSPPFFPYT